MSSGPPAVRVLLADDVYARIKREIHNFGLLPGDRFTEAELCERLEVSRTPIRQALFRLQQEGHVEVLFRNGWRVLPFDFRKYDALYDFRILIETESVDRICGGTSRLAPEALRQSLDALAEVWLVPKARRLSDPQTLSEIDEGFHCALVAAAGNPEIAATHREITDRIRVIRKLDFTRVPRVEMTYEEHGKILRAVLNRKTAQARLLLKAHIEASQAEVKKITLHQLHAARERLGTQETPAA